MQYSDIYDANNLYEAYRKCKSGSDWKHSVQSFQFNLLSNMREIQKQLENETYKQKPFVEFDLHERGKVRHIKSMHISDRIVQRSFCDNIVTPALGKYLIYDNGASIEGKGVDFAKKRLEVHLQKYYRKYGNEGYILLLDCSKFFDNLPHEIIHKEIQNKIPKDCEKFFMELIDTFKIDISMYTKEEQNELINGIFNSLSHAKEMRSASLFPVWMRKSVGIGSQISQNCGTFLPTRVDNYIKIVRGVKFYGRYMDDSYIIHYDKKYLQSLVPRIIEQYKALGLTININKTKIMRIDKGFTWLKVRYKLTKSGKIIRRIAPSSITRMRRKLKKLKKKMEQHKLPYPSIEYGFKSWSGTLKHYNASRSQENITQLFKQLFQECKDYERNLNKTIENLRFNRRLVIQCFEHWRLESGQNLRGSPAW